MIAVLNEDGTVGGEAATGLLYDADCSSNPCCDPCACVRSICAAFAGLEILDGCRLYYPVGGTVSGDGSTKGFTLSSNRAYPSTCYFERLVCPSGGTGLTQNPGWLAEPCPEGDDVGDPVTTLFVSIFRNSTTTTIRVQALIGAGTSVIAPVLFQASFTLPGCGETLVLNNELTDFDAEYDYYTGDLVTGTFKPFAIGGTVTLTFNDAETPAACSEDVEYEYPFQPCGSPKVCYRRYTSRINCVESAAGPVVEDLIKYCLPPGSKPSGWRPALGAREGLVDLEYWHETAAACLNNGECSAVTVTPPAAPDLTERTGACGAKYIFGYRFVYDCKNHEVHTPVEPLNPPVYCGAEGDPDFPTTWSPVQISSNDDELLVEFTIFVYVDQPCNEGAPTPPADPAPPTAEEIAEACPSSCPDLSGTWIDYFDDTPGGGTFVFTADPEDPDSYTWTYTVEGDPTVYEGSLTCNGDGTLTYLFGSPLYVAAGDWDEDEIDFGDGYHIEKV